MTDRLAYLASPYSDPDPAVRQARFESVCREAARLMRRGHLVLSPIAHTHPIATVGALPLGWEYWSRYGRQLVARCDEVQVLKLDGWRTSVGVQAEIALARQLGKPVRFIFPRGRCDRCGQHYARSGKGVWKHHCQGSILCALEHAGPEASGPEKGSLS